MGKNKKNLQDMPALDRENMVILDLTNLPAEEPVAVECQKFKLSTDKKKPNLFKRFLNWFRK